MSNQKPKIWRNPSMILFFSLGLLVMAIPISAIAEIQFTQQNKSAVTDKPQPVSSSQNSKPPTSSKVVNSSNEETAKKSPDQNQQPQQQQQKQQQPQQQQQKQQQQQSYPDPSRPWLTQQEIDANRAERAALEGQLSQYQSLYNDVQYQLTQAQSEEARFCGGGSPEYNFASCIASSDRRFNIESRMITTNSEITILTNQINNGYWY